MQIRITGNKNISHVFHLFLGRIFLEDSKLYFKPKIGNIYVPYIHCAVREHIIGPCPRPDKFICPSYQPICVNPSTPFYQAAFVLQFTWTLYTSDIPHTFYAYGQSNHLWFYHHNNFWREVRGCVGTALQAGRSRVRFPMGLLKFPMDLILWPWNRLIL
jgi:hypothetical protein